jgi:hypothetical protein
MEKAQYQYRPLESDHAIRILNLDPGARTDPLKGALEIVPIESTGKYEALSYVWADAGPPNTAYEITLRNHEANDAGVLALRGGSIFAALRRLRLPDQPRRIWADQCCINQNDLVERSQQVHFMNRIYQGAAHVLVWLGLDTKDEALSAFSFVHKLDETFGKYAAMKDVSREQISLELWNDVELNHSVLRSLTNRNWVGVPEIAAVQAGLQRNAEITGSSDADG